MLLFLTLFSVITINQVSSATLNDYPLKMDPGNWIINAIVTDIANGQQIIIKEYISSGEILRGKIELDIKGQALTVLQYSNQLTNLRNCIYKNEIFYSECTVFVYSKGSWNYYLAGTSGPYVSDISLIGPSLIFRLANQPLKLMRESDVIIRGVLHNQYSSSLSYINMSVRFFLKAHRSESDVVDISKSTRVILEASTGSKYGAHTVRMDIYSIEHTNQQLDSIVTLRPGTICHNYLTTGLHYDGSSIPQVKSQRIHFISLETISTDKSKLIQKEVFADEKFQMISMKTTISESNLPMQTSEMIYDYYLGIVYELKHEGGPEKCKMLPMDLTAPGLIVNSEGKWRLSINKLLDLNGNYMYLGPVNYKHEYSDFVAVESWQANNYGSTIDGNQYDLIMSTQYFLQVVQSNSEKNSKLIGTTYHTFNKTAKSSYSTLLATKKIDYQVFSTDAQFLQNWEEKFGISDCYPNLESRKTFALHFSCKDSNCNHFMRNHHKQFTERLKESISSLGTISMSRIEEIELVFKPNDTIAYVTFLESPDIKDAFTRRNVKISRESIPDINFYNVKSNDECLIANVNVAEPFEAIAYCGGEEKVCTRFHKLTDIIEDTATGTLCQVTLIPIRNIYRYSKEMSLKDIEKKHYGLSFNLSDGSITAEYKLYQLQDVSIAESEIESRFQKTIASFTLTRNSDSVITVTGSLGFSSCYRSCVHSDAIDCRSFSFCQRTDSVDCLVSNSTIEPENLTNDTNCVTYEPNFINRYLKIESRKFIKPTSIEIEETLSDCAQRCFDYNQCKSFQYCPESLSCTFSSYYTDLSTNYTLDCDIFIPKVINKFKMTGNQIVTDTFHTEFEVNVDQCAALCHDWTDQEDDNQTCSSFNYCPSETKTSSMCLLSRYAPGDVKNGQFKLINQSNCRNYGLIKKKHSTLNVSVFQSDSNVPGILFMVFLFTVSGLLTGFIVSIILIKFKRRQSEDISSTTIFNRNTFSWTRQLNDGRQSSFQDTKITKDTELDEI